MPGPILFITYAVVMRRSGFIVSQEPRQPPQKQIFSSGMNGNDAVADGLPGRVRDLVESGDGVGHDLRLRFPQPRRALDIGQ
jgi:hypothetical protein